MLLVKATRFCEGCAGDKSRSGFAKITALFLKDLKIDSVENVWYINWDCTTILSANKQVTKKVVYLTLSTAETQFVKINGWRKTVTTSDLDGSGK